MAEIHGVGPTHKKQKPESGYHKKLCLKFESSTVELVEKTRFFNQELCYYMEYRIGGNGEVHHRDPSELIVIESIRWYEDTVKNLLVKY